MARPTEFIQSSFSLSDSAMKNSVSFAVESSNACARLMTSSAPLMVRHLPTLITPRGWESCVTPSPLNQNMCPCFNTNQRRRQVLRYSPCLVSHPERSGSFQNSIFFDSSGMFGMPKNELNAMSSSTERASDFVTLRAARCKELGRRNPWSGLRNAVKTNRRQRLRRRDKNGCECTT